MKTIFACGNDPTIETELIRYFSKRPAILLHPNRFQVLGQELLICFSAEPPKSIRHKNTVILFYSPIRKMERFSVPPHLIGLSESSNKSALQLLMQNKNPVITYGLTPTDTITASSFGESKTQIALQREIIGLSGQTIEPFEFSIPNDNFSKITQLIIGAIKILCGEI